ncbi:unnamed protein product [Trichogramma brassicae]|uniref:Uncharacterized protein n=1 Tax=Trichogramma brassicae TaxID=86971 RepID=A0A6H5J9I3_9HYME|nr:unnamed protein product [Trichogramma brassicae]
MNDYEDEPDLDEYRKPILRRTTAVHLAAELKLMPQLERLFEIYNKFHVNYEDDTGLTHFHAACMSSRHDVVKEFLNSGQDPNGLPQGQVYRDPPLTFAVRNKRINVVELLLENGAEPNLPYEEGQRPLHFICQDYDYDEDTLERFFKICKLRGKPVNVNAQTDGIMSTPLHEALRYDNNKMASFLIRKGANINLADFMQNTSLHYFCERDPQDLDLLQLFLDKPEVDVKALNVDELQRRRRRTGYYIGFRKRAAIGWCELCAGMYSCCCPGLLKSNRARDLLHAVLRAVVAKQRESFAALNLRGAASCAPYSAAA